MTRQEFAELLLEIQDQEREVREAGQKEYAHADTNAFRNFENIGAQLNMTREKVLWVYMQKHLDGVLAYINGHRSQREDITGRLKDARMYLALLWGMVQEERKETENPMSIEIGELEPASESEIDALLASMTSKLVTMRFKFLGPESDGGPKSGDRLPQIPVDVPTPPVKSPRSPEIHGDPQTTKASRVSNERFAEILRDAAQLCDYTVTSVEGRVVARCNEEYGHDGPHTLYAAQS